MLVSVRQPGSTQTAGVNVSLLMPHSTTLTAEDKAACRELARLFNQQKAAHGMTHKELAALIGMSDKSVSAMINGRMRISVKTGRKLAKVFSVPLTQILPFLADTVDEAGRLSTIIEMYRELEQGQQHAVAMLIQGLIEEQRKKPK